MQADVNVSPGPALLVILSIIAIGALAGWIWVRRLRKYRGSSARPAVFSLLGNVTESALPDGWSDEQIVALIGDVSMDLRNRPPTDGAIPSRLPFDRGRPASCLFWNPGDHERHHTPW